MCVIGSAFRTLREEHGGGSGWIVENINTALSFGTVYTFEVSVNWIIKNLENKKRSTSNKLNRVSIYLFFVLVRRHNKRWKIDSNRNVQYIQREIHCVVTQYKHTFIADKWHTNKKEDSPANSFRARTSQIRWKSWNTTDTLHYR